MGDLKMNFETTEVPSSVLLYARGIMEQELNVNPQTKRKYFAFGDKEGVVYVTYNGKKYIQLQVLYDKRECERNIYKCMSNRKYRKRMCLQLLNE
jgi:hypothetical protein